MSTSKKAKPTKKSGQVQGRDKASVRAFTASPDTISEKPPRDSRRGKEDEAAFKTFLAETVAKVEGAREQMKNDQIEIDRLKSETRAMIARLLAA
jgi:hypothetical protein